MHRVTGFTAWQANPTDILDRNCGHREVENRGHYACSLGYEQDTVGIFFARSGGDLVEGCWAWRAAVAAG